MRMLNFKTYLTKGLTVFGITLCLFYYLQRTQQWDANANTDIYLRPNFTSEQNVKMDPAANRTSLPKQKQPLLFKAKKASMKNRPVEKILLVKEKKDVQNENEKILEEKGSLSSLEELAVSSPPKELESSQDLPLTRSAVDWSRGAWRPWPGDAQCGDVTVHYGRQLPRRALVSFPGSGNTWARYLVEGATGLHTGSRYDDQELSVRGFRGEMEPWNSGTTILQKTHLNDDEEVSRFEGRAVLIVRNPYKAIVAAHNFAAGGHRGYASVSNYRRSGWKIFVHNNLRRWLLTAQQWLTKGSDVQVLHYELLQEDLSAALSDLLRSLRLPVSPHRLTCLQKHNAGVFHRKSQYFPEGVEIFSASLRKLIDRAIRYVDCLLVKKKLPRLPLHLYEFYNGTLPQGMIYKACEDGRTRAQCDAAVDELNRERRKEGSAALAVTSQPWHAILKSAGDGAQDTRLSFTEWLYQHPVVMHMNEYFMDVLSKLGPDLMKHQKLDAPVQELINMDQNGTCF